MSLHALQDWLIARCSDAANTGAAAARIGRAVVPQSSRPFGVEPGPGTWGETYLDRVIQNCPAIRVAFQEAPARDDDAPALVDELARLGIDPEFPRDALTLDTRWSVYVATKWIGQDRDAPVALAWPAALAIAACLHEHRPEAPSVLDPVPDAPPWHDYGDAVDTAGIARVTGIENLWTGALDDKGVALVAVGVEVPLAIDPGTAAAELDDFLRAGDAWRGDVLAGVYTRAAGLAGLQEGQFALTPELADPNATGRLVWRPAAAEEDAFAAHWRAGEEIAFFGGAPPWTAAGVLRLDAIREPAEGFRFIADVKLLEGAVPAVGADTRAAFGPTLSGDPFSIPQGDDA